jgi:hypothetical protein
MPERTVELDGATDVQNKRNAILFKARCERHWLDPGRL